MLNNWTIELPDDLVPFERLTERERSLLAGRISEQFTTEAAVQLYDLGSQQEKTEPLLPVPVEQNRAARMKVELVRSAYEDWQCFSRRLGPALEAAVHVLGADTDYGSCVVPLPRPQGFLLRHGHLRIVYRREPRENRILLHAIGCWAINPLAKIWRYFDQEKAASLLTTGKLYLRRLDLLTDEFEGDPYEGSPTFDMFTVWKRVCRQTLGYLDDAQLMKRYEHERRATFVSCWQKSEHESWLMWKQYCRKGGGIALQTTERKLHHALTKMREGRDTLYLRSVHYIDHWSDDPLPHEVPLQVFLKPAWFSDEREIRFAWFRGERAWAGTDEQIEVALSKLDKGEPIPFGLSDVVERIVLNPFSDERQRDSIVTIVRSEFPTLEARLCDSQISKKPATGYHLNR